MTVPSYIVGNPSLVSMVFCLASICCLFIGLVIQFQEMNNKNEFLSFAFGYKYQTIIPLNPLNKRKVNQKTNLMIEYLMKQIFWPSVLVTYIVYIIAIIIVYLDPNSGFSLILCIFWSFISIVTVLQFNAMVSVGFVIWVFAVLYLKYIFYEINEKLKISFDSKNYSILLQVINEHNSISKRTKQLNEFFSLFIFVIYFIGTPGLMIIIYLTHEKDTYYYIRYAFGFVFCLIFSIVFLVNLMSSQISQSSHKPYKLLFNSLHKSDSLSA